MEVRPHDVQGERVIFNRNYFKHCRLALVGDEIEVTNRWNRSRRFPLARTGVPGAAHGVVFAFVWLKSVQAFRTVLFPYRKLLIIDGAGNTLTSLPVLRRGGYGLDRADEFDSVWSRADVAQLCAAAGLAYTERAFADTEELQRTHPGAIRLHRFYAHPQRYVWWSVLIVFAAIAVLIAIEAVIAALG